MGIISSEPQRSKNSDYPKKLLHWDKDNEIKVYDYSKLSVAIFAKKKWGLANGPGLRDIGALFNWHLKTDEGDVAPGYIY